MPVLSTGSPEIENSKEYAIRLAGETALGGTVETSQEQIDKFMKGDSGDSAEPNKNWPPLDPDANYDRPQINDAQPVQEATENNNNEA